jgi:hypothetical protein
MDVATADLPLYQIVSAAAPTDVAGVIAVMQAIDACLPVTDGLKWFNQIYLEVTQSVDNQPRSNWQSPDWLLQLDVTFAGFYLRALTGYLSGDAAVPSSWRALLDARFETGIDRIQFALAGFNAHINHDLALALNATAEQMGLGPDATAPGASSPEHSDYRAVNALLNATTPAALTVVAADTLGVLAEDTGKVGRLLAFWDIVKARDLAWDFAAHLRSLPAIAQQPALDAQDALTGALGRALLAMV